jgi:hypothetical protein
MVVELRDEEILGVEPATLVGYTPSPIGGPQDTIAFR